MSDSPENAVLLAPRMSGMRKSCSEEFPQTETDSWFSESDVRSAERIGSEWRFAGRPRRKVHHGRSRQLIDNRRSGKALPRVVTIVRLTDRIFWVIVRAQQLFDRII